MNSYLLPSSLSHSYTLSHPLPREWSPPQCVHLPASMNTSQVSRHAHRRPDLHDASLRSLLSGSTLCQVDQSGHYMWESFSHFWQEANEASYCWAEASSSSPGLMHLRWCPLSSEKMKAHVCPSQTQIAPARLQPGPRRMGELSWLGTSNDRVRF